MTILCNAILFCALFSILVSAAAVDYRVEYAVQPIDHFNDYNTDTFEQRYFINDTYFNPSNPTIFFYGAGEGELSYFHDHAGGTFRQWAQEYGAMTIFCEHRFYGRSIPKDPLFNAFSLNIEQALADFAALIQMKNDEYGFRFKVVAAGGSYSGEMALYLRTKYPQLVTAAIGSSAPFMMMGYKYDDDLPMNFEYYRKVTSVFAQIDKRCSQITFNAFEQMKKLFQLQNFDAVQQQLFLCQKPTADSLRSLQFWLREAFAGLTQGNIPSDIDADSMVGVQACRFLVKQDQNFPLAAVGKMLAFAYGPIDPDQPCYNAFDDSNSSLASFTRPVSQSPRYKQFVATQAKQVKKDNTCMKKNFIDGEWTEDDSWTYQMCTQTLYYQNTSGKNDTSTNMFARIISTDQDYLDMCTKRFNLPSSALHQWRKVSTNYPYSHADWRQTASRVIISNGLWDPWCGGGVNVGGRLNPTSILINIPTGAHHVDLNTPTKNDFKEVVDIRQLEYQLIVEFLKDQLDMTKVNSIATTIAQRYPNDCSK